MICKNCGHDNIVEAKFCEECGTALEAQKQYEQPVKKQSNTHIVLISVIIVVCLIAGVAGFFFVRINNAKKEEAAKVERQLKEQLEEEKKKAEAAKDALTNKEIEEAKKEAEKAKEEADAAKKEAKAAKEASEKKAENKSSTNSNASSGYMISYSHQRILTSSDIKGMSLREINYAKNEIYARKGRIFQSPELSNYFNSKSWYRGTIQPENFSNDLLSDTEKKNAEFLSDVEFSMSSSGYQLDAN
ncbi:outer membrane biosynthesis protein TonB [Aequitasia blattaphilus]|uniref:YARHG domain-containing protein n=1 Tax=Aequitasia blattaphilus TaxID=2949332 RepID=A0ABT1E5X2_9FIRM|nr:YARHG domain-containing protein [Aequitasia blattaphilus]MCP1101240.1 YARHG domain-containing protein [Aequitasia blattaphilus]MCR8613880.1 YARHG domain-containing protein [Aequitasia blattaphilus]